MCKTLSVTLNQCCFNWALYLNYDAMAIAGTWFVLWETPNDLPLGRPPLQAPFKINENSAIDVLYLPMGLVKADLQVAPASSSHKP